MVDLKELPNIKLWKLECSDDIICLTPLYWESLKHEIPNLVLIKKWFMEGKKVNDDAIRKMGIKICNSAFRYRTKKKFAERRLSN